MDAMLREAAPKTAHTDPLDELWNESGHSSAEDDRRHEKRIQEFKRSQQRNGRQPAVPKKKPAKAP